jgi:hypothetical protein
MQNLGYGHVLVCGVGVPDVAWAVLQGRDPGCGVVA